MDNPFDKSLKESVLALASTIKENHPALWLKLEAGLQQLYNISDKAEVDDKMAGQWRMLYESIKKDIPEIKPGKSMKDKAKEAMQ